METQRTLVLIKPDGMQRGLAGEILARFERRGLRLVGLKLIQVDDALARRHYAEHEGKPFFQGLIRYIQATPIVAAVLEGTNAVEAVRQTMGATNPLQAAPGTIRADYGLEIGRNLVHGSATPADAEREIGLFFNEHEIFRWERNVDEWVFEPGREA